jgi:hypothetical protein
LLASVSGTYSLYSGRVEPYLSAAPAKVVRGSRLDPPETPTRSTCGAPSAPAMSADRRVRGDLNGTLLAAQSVALSSARDSVAGVGLTCHTVGPYRDRLRSAREPTRAARPRGSVNDTVNTAAFIRGSTPQRDPLNSSRDPGRVESAVDLRGRLGLRDPHRAHPLFGLEPQGYSPEKAAKTRTGRETPVCGRFPGLWSTLVVRGASSRLGGGSIPCRRRRLAPVRSAARAHSAGLGREGTSGGGTGRTQVDPPDLVVRVQGGGRRWTRLGEPEQTCRTPSCTRATGSSRRRVNPSACSVCRPET